MSRFFEATKRRQTEPDMQAPEMARSVAEVPAPVVIPSSIPESTGPVSRRYHTVQLRLAPNAPLIFSEGAAPEADEQYRMLRTRVAHHPSHPTIICVTSAGVGDGKTVNAVNIATSFALKKQSTILAVDADLRNPQLSRLLGLQDAPGLTEFLSGNLPLSKAIVRVEGHDGLHVLPAGKCSGNATELLDSDRLASLVSTLRQEFSFTIIDSAPLGLVADYELIEGACDGVLLVARPGSTKRSLLQNALAKVNPEKFLGVVVNCAENWFLAKHPSLAAYYPQQDK
jgi:capsular exopolysaccharide synthesis family protein